MPWLVATVQIVDTRCRTFHIWAVGSVWCIVAVFLETAGPRSYPKDRMSGVGVGGGESNLRPASPGLVGLVV